VRGRGSKQWILAVGIPFLTAIATNTPLPQASGTEEVAIVFSDVTAQAGLWDPLLRMFAHAAAWGDVNGDGWQDLFVGTFADKADEKYLVRGATGRAPDRLLLGGPEGFSLAEGFPERFGRTSGAAFADLDGDGDLDLVVSRNRKATTGTDAPTEVLRGEGDGTFSVVAELLGDRRARSIGVLDYDGDSRLDLFVSGERQSGGAGVLLRNQGDLQFLDVTASAGLPLDLFGLGVGVADLDLDGWPDLVVSGSTPGPTPGVVRGARLFLNSRASGFREVDNSAFVWPSFGPEDWVAGVAVGDLNRDGLPDVVLGQHFGSTLSKGTVIPVRVYLHRGLGVEGGPVFEDVTEASGIPSFSTKAPHVEIADFDNDGWPDLLATASSEGGTRATILRHLGVTNDIPVFGTAEGLGSAQYWPTGGSADVNLDGVLDLFLAEWYPSLPSILLQGATSGGHWLSVEVLPNVQGIGSVVEVYRAGELGDPAALLSRTEITATTGYGAGVPSMAHVGLGEEVTVDVRIRVPRGQELIDLPAVAADQALRVTASPPALTSADLSVVGSDAPDPVTVHGALTYELTAANADPDSALDVVLTAVLPAAAALASATSGQGSCSGTVTVSCTIGTLGADQSVVVTLAVEPTAAGTFTMTASAAGTTADPDPADNATALVTTVSPEEVPPAEEVVITGTGFSPATVDVAQGSAVQWEFQGTTAQSVADSSKSGLFGSGALGPGSTYSFTFAVAGSYAYHDGLHSTLRGSVQIRMTYAAPATPTAIALAWASAPPPSGFVADVQVRRPGSSQFVTWLTGTIGTGGTFVPDAGLGRYAFRSRLRNAATGKAVKYSPILSIAVA
jgi:plastocyanin